MSSSKSSSASETTQIDGRVASEGEAEIIIGGGGSVQITDEFPEAVGDFANNILATLNRSLDLNQNISQGSVAAVKTIAARDQSSALFAQDILDNLLPIAGLAAVTFIAYTYFKRRK